jgi:membrane peptidoglycan carboxypeptidase
MVSEDDRRPQRKSTRPVQGEGPQWRSTGASGAGPRRPSPASGAQPQRRSTASGPQPVGRDKQPGSIEPRAFEPRAKGLRAYDETAAAGRTRPTTGSTSTNRSRPTTGSTSTNRKRPTTGSTSTRGAGSGGGKKGGKGGPPRDRHGKPIPRWKYLLRRIGIGALAAGLAVFLIGFVGLFIRYQTLHVPPPSSFALQQASTIYYADGTTVMGRLGQADRQIVNVLDLPKYVRMSFVAAEDRSFYTNPGVDIAGTTRALIKTVVFGKKQGGSTITQQYVERYYVGKTTTDIKGKIDEALLALKIDKQQGKDEVLGNYMNTVYFGRGAYGIEAASRKYFGKPATELTVSESAMLAGILPAPSRWDPRLNLAQATFRWNYVLDGMVQGGTITQTDREALVFPTTIEYANNDIFAGTQGYLLRTALDEVTAMTGKTQEDIETQGLKIVTTIQPAAQQSIEAAVAKMPTDAAPNLRVAAVTMDPTTGAITGMYGGADYLTIQRNAATQDIAQAGSTFKPFALVAALESGISLNSVYNGDNKKTVAGFDTPVRNFLGESFGDINLIQATAYSVNTVYTQLNVKVGPDKTRDVAIRAGIPEGTAGLDTNPSNVLGAASPHALDLASAYSTYATGGLSTQPFMVASVTDSQGNNYYEHPVTPKRVFKEDVMADATYAMQQVVNYKGGSGHFASALGRPVAGKTGTSDANRSAWFVGFTPQQVGVVGMYQVGPNGEAEQITPFGGFTQITGGSMPVRIWTWMMEPIVKDMPVVDFPARANVGKANTPTPSAAPAPSTKPSATPSHKPTPKPNPTPTPNPLPTLAAPAKP